MRCRSALIGGFLLCCLAAFIQAAEKYSLKVLYVGSLGMPQAEDFLKFLRTRFVRAEAVEREGFKAASAAGWDVVLLDWPQGRVQFVLPGKPGPASVGMADPLPLGARESWSKPTVLLGSAGLKLAEAWKIGGGYG